MNGHSLSSELGSLARAVGDWFRRAEVWQLALAALALVILLPLLPAVLVVLVLAALGLFARAWTREFAFLMRLPDDAFPGRNDKLIWAVLLIVLPPVGATLFGSYRQAHWPEAKPAPKPADPISW